MRLVSIFVFVIFFLSCSKNKCRESITPVEVDIKIDRIEPLLFDSKSGLEVQEVMKKYPEFTLYLLRKDQYPNDSILANRIFQLTQHPSIDTVFMEATQAFSDLSSTIRDLEEGYGRLKSLYPEVKIPTLQTIVTGLAEHGDLFISDSVVIVGIDYFIGQDATYKPTQIPAYIARRYTKQHLPALILQFASGSLVAPGIGETLLIDMINYGKGYYLLSKLLPCTPEYILMGYSEEEWSDVIKNEDIIWANFIQNKWFYETNRITKQKFLGERPKVFEIGQKCPGRIGAWLGWQIVKQYAESNDVTIQKIVAETDHNKIFALSNYKPKS